MHCAKKRQYDVCANALARLAYSLLSFYTVCAVEAETLTETMARSHMRRAAPPRPRPAPPSHSAGRIAENFNYSGLHSGCIDLQS